MSRLVIVPAWLLGVCAVPALLTPAAPAQQPEPTPPAELRRPDGQPKSPDFIDFSGRVMAIDATSVTVQGWTGSVPGGDALSNEERRLAFANHHCLHRGAALVLFLPDDRVLPCRRVEFARETITVTDREGDVKVLRRSDEPHRKFTLSNSLARGDTGDSPMFQGNTAYRASDVRIGDEVQLDLSGPREQKVCVRILIERRPGGRVPPAPQETVYEGRPHHHEFQNVLQDWESGSPIPEAYRKYFAEVLPSPTPVAPEPRMLPLRIPSAMP